MVANLHNQVRRCCSLRANVEPSVTKPEFMRLMNIPQEWESWGMYPEELYAYQLERFEVAHARAPEHDRNGMFHWWLRRNPAKHQLLPLSVLLVIHRRHGDITASDVLYERDQSERLSLFIHLHSTDPVNTIVLDPDRGNRNVF